MQPGKYKMKKIPNLLRPFLNTFNLFISFFIGAVYLSRYNFGSYLSVPYRYFVISPSRVLKTPAKVESDLLSSCSWLAWPASRTRKSLERVQQ